MLVALVLAAAVFDPQTGAVTVQRGVLSAPLTGELSSAARAWALARRSELGLPPDSTLVNTDSFGTRFGASFHLQQQVRGVEVYGSNLVVTLDKQARVMLVTSGLASYQTVRGTWLIDDTEAKLRATRQVMLPALKSDGTPYAAAKKVFFQVGDELHAGWVVFVATLEITKNMYLGIDATTGEVLWRQNRVFNAALDANVYNPSPGGLDAGVGVTPTIKVQVMHLDGGTMLAADAGGVFSGTQLDSFNCCVYKNCDPSALDAGPKRSTGSTMLPNPLQPGTTLTVNYDLVTCDFKHSATNDPARHDAGSFEYTPVDPPAAGAFSLNDPANSDEFAEVHAFFHVNREYDWVRGLSAAATPIFPGNQPAITPFQMRDEKRGPSRKPAIWSNVVFPDFQQIIANPGCVFSGTPCIINGFTRIDNAAFLAVENFAQIPLPEYRNDVDTLMIFQGPNADFGYDPPVLWHEFGHGVVTATANLGLDRLSIDTRSANNESGALHEGFSDYIAGAFGGDSFMGRYVGPRITGAGGMTGIRTEPFLRSLDNSLSCPEVLHGEVHDDSQHVAAALWRARQDVFQGNDDGGTFDAVFYASLVSLSATADFAQVATVMSAHVDKAWPDAGQQMAAIFDQRGVTNCSKVIDMTGAPPRSIYGIGSRSQTPLSSGLIPGPVQLRLRVPQGARSVTVTGAVAQDAFGLGGSAPTLKALARAGGPLLFTRNGNALTNNSTASGDMVVANGTAQAVLDITVPCGATSEIYATVANGGTAAATLQNLTISAITLTNCMLPVDAGMMPGTDGGTDGGGGTMTTTTPAITTVEGPFVGCGCNATPLALPFVLLLAVRAMRRRRQ